MIFWCYSFSNKEWLISLWPKVKGQELKSSHFMQLTSNPLSAYSESLTFITSLYFCFKYLKTASQHCLNKWTYWPSCTHLPLSLQGSLREVSGKMHWERIPPLTAWQRGGMLNSDMAYKDDYTKVTEVMKFKLSVSYQLHTMSNMRESTPATRSFNLLLFNIIFYNFSRSEYLFWDNPTVVIQLSWD